MEKQRKFFLAIALLLLFMTIWQPFVGFLDKQFPGLHLLPHQAADTTPATASQSTPAVPQASSAPAIAGQPSTSTSGVAVNTTGPAIAAALPAPAWEPQKAEHPMPGWIGSQGTATDDSSPCKMQIDISPAGASIGKVFLNGLRPPDLNGLRQAAVTDRYVFQTPYATDSNVNGSLQTRQLLINDFAVDLTNVDWIRDNGAADSTSVSYHVDVKSATGYVRITRKFEVATSDPKADPQGKKWWDETQGYEPRITCTFDNQTSQQVKLQLTFNGPTMPPRESERNDDRQLLEGYAKPNDASVAIEHQALSAFSDAAPRDLTKNSDGLPLAWFGTGSVYFNAIVHPLPSTGSTAIGIESVTATALNADKDVKIREVALSIRTTPFNLDSKAQASLPLAVFLGPKERDLLTSDYYKGSLRYDSTLVITSKWCGFCTFNPVISFLMSMLSFFHTILFHDWGLAIICLVVIVRTILHPITKKSQISMAGMQKMAPEIERLKKKYGDNKEELNKAMMDVYKQQGVGPVLGCLPMFLQTPIWIALYAGLQSEFQLRQAPFLWFGRLHLTWISDLAQPDRLYAFAHPISLYFFGMELLAINVLPLLMAIVFYVQQQLQPKPATITPEQAQQQKMMKWLPLMFPIFLYSAPSGLNLYILTSTTIGIIESKIIRKHLKEKEEAEKAGRILVDVKPSRTAKTLARDKQDATDAPRGCLAGWMENIQKRVEEAKKEADRQKRKK